MSSLPTQVQAFRNLFDGKPSWLSGKDSFGIPQAVGTRRASQDEDFGTELESEYTGSMQVDSDTSFRDNPDYCRHSPEFSHPGHPFSLERPMSVGVSSSDSFEIDCATSPIVVPANLTFDTDSTAYSYSESMESLPSPMKEFRDMFEDNSS